MPTRSQPSAQPASPPLWQLLQAAARVLAAVQAGASTTPVLGQLPAHLRPGAQALSFAALRRWGRAQALRTLLAKRPPKAPADALLCTALALMSDALGSPTHPTNGMVAGPTYDDFTLVNQAVEAAKRQASTAGQAAFINACLRRAVREREGLQVALAKDETAVWNHPAWWIQRLRSEWPEHWQQILGVNNAQPPLALRVNTRKTTREVLQNAIESIAGRGHLSGDSGLILSKAMPVQQLPGFAEGWFSVQDPAAQLAAPCLLSHWLDAGHPLAPNSSSPPSTPPLRVLDACAAPGGKTAHVLELASRIPVGIDLLALDVDAQRCRLIEHNLHRLGLDASGDATASAKTGVARSHVQVRAADAANPEAWWDGQPFDAILLDAPCTASGIVRRHPDVRWLRRESDIRTLAAQQARLLAALWPLLKPQGRLLYCTCSVFQAEGPGQIQAFLAHHTDASLLPSPGQLLPLNGANPGAVPDNGPNDRDGFFYALLAKA